MFILNHHLKNKQRCTIKKLSTETEHRPTDHSSTENYVLPLITNWTSTSSEGTETKTGEKWNFLFYFFSRGCEILLMSKLAIFTLSCSVCLNKVSSTSYRILSTFFACAQRTLRHTFVTMDFTKVYSQWHCISLHNPCSALCSIQL